MYHFNSHWILWDHNLVISFSVLWFQHFILGTSSDTHFTFELLITQQTWLKCFRVSAEEIIDPFIFDDIWTLCGPFEHLCSAAFLHFCLSSHSFFLCVCGSSVASTAQLLTIACAGINNDLLNWSELNWMETYFGESDLMLPRINRNFNMWVDS